MEQAKREPEVMVPMINPAMPLVPEILMSAMPTPVPQMRWEAGIIPNFIHNIKLGQLEKAATREAAIMREKNAYVQSGLAMVKSIVTFSAELDLQFKKIRHEEKMMQFTEQQAEAGVNKTLLENQILFYQAKNEEMDYKAKIKNFEEQHGTSAP